MVDKLSISTGFHAGFLNHQQYHPYHPTSNISSNIQVDPTYHHGYGMPQRIIKKSGPLSLPTNSNIQFLTAIHLFDRHDAHNLHRSLENAGVGLGVFELGFSCFGCSGRQNKKYSQTVGMGRILVGIITNKWQETALIYLILVWNLFGGGELVT